MTSANVPEYMVTAMPMELYQSQHGVTTYVSGDPSHNLESTDMDTSCQKEVSQGTTTLAPCASECADINPD